jgi:hypothetical protein
VIGVECCPNTYGAMILNGKNILGKKFVGYHGYIYDFFTNESPSHQKKFGFDKGLDFVDFEYCQSYSDSNRLDIEAFLNNKSMLDASFNGNQGDIYFYQTSSCRNTAKEVLKRLYNHAEKFKNLSPKISYATTEGQILDRNRFVQDHAHSYGLHYEISAMCLERNIAAEQIRAVFYRDGARGTRMLFTTWRLTRRPINQNTHRPPVLPVYMGIRLRNNHLHSNLWKEEMRRKAIFNIREDEHALTHFVHEGVQKALRTKSEKSKVALSLFAPALVKDFNEKGLSILRMGKKIHNETSLANVKVGPPRERSAMAAVEIVNILKNKKSGETQKNITDKVLEAFPEWIALINNGSLTKAKLINEIAFGKLALSTGGYTDIKKSKTPESKPKLTLTKKGRNTIMEPDVTTSWAEHFMLIKKGMI